MLLRLSEHMWQRCSLSGFPTLLILLSSFFHWWRVGGGPWPFKIGVTKGPGWSTLTGLCPTWFLVSQTPCHCWWGCPTQCCMDGTNQGRGWPHPQGAHLTAERKTPKDTLQRMVQGICHCPPPIEGVQIWMGTPW